MHGGGKIKRHSMFAMLLLLAVAVLPAGVSAVDSNTTASNVTANAKVNPLHPAHQHQRFNYTYNEYVPYKVRVKVSYMKPYTVKVRTPVKTYYYKKGKYRVRYVYSYSYVTRYRKDYKGLQRPDTKRFQGLAMLNLGITCRKQITARFQMMK